MKKIHNCSIIVFFKWGKNHNLNLLCTNNIPFLAVNVPWFQSYIHWRASILEDNHIVTTKETSPPCCCEVVNLPFERNLRRLDQDWWVLDENCFWFYVECHVQALLWCHWWEELDPLPCFFGFVFVFVVALWPCESDPLGLVLIFHHLSWNWYDSSTGKPVFHLDELCNKHNAFLFIPDSEVVFCFVGLVLYVFVFYI